MARILHIGKYYPPFAGGIEHFMADLLPAQQQHGAQAAALVHDHHIQLSRSFARVKADSTIDTPNIYRVPSYGRLVYAPLSPQFPIWLQRVLRDWQPEVLHIHMPNTSAFWLLRSRLARQIPWVIHWHSDVVSTAASLDSRLNWLYPPYRYFEQALLAHAHGVLVTSPPYLATSSALQAWQAKCHVVPLGISLARLPAVNDPESSQWAAQQWHADKLKVLCIGRLTYYKGQQFLIQALAEMPNAQLCVVGSGEQHAVLQQLVVDLNLQARVKLLGYCADAQLQALLHSCDCLCLPSLERTEAFGMVLLEAMRYAKPVIASAVTGSGMTWVVQQGKTGLLVPPQDVMGLSRALRVLHEASPLRQHMGQAGANRFFNHFSIEAVARDINNIYAAHLD